MDGYGIFNRNFSKMHGATQIADKKKEAFFQIMKECLFLRYTATGYMKTTLYKKQRVSQRYIL